MYTAWYTQGLGGHPGYTSRHGTISDGYVEPLIEYISQWSGGRFTAARGRHNLITVVPINIRTQKVRLVRWYRIWSTWFASTWENVPRHRRMLNEFFMHM